MALKLKINLDTVLKLPLGKKAAIVAAVNVVIAGLFYWFLTGPKYAEVRELTAQMDELNVKLNENRSIAADIPKYLSEKDEMEKKRRGEPSELMDTLIAYRWNELLGPFDRDPAAIRWGRKR